MSTITNQAPVTNRAPVLNRASMIDPAMQQDAGDIDRPRGHVPPMKRFTPDQPDQPLAPAGRHWHLRHILRHATGTSR